MEQEKVRLHFDNITNPWVKESIRSLRNKFILADLEHKVFCVSSMYPKEGVTTIVRMVANSLSEIQKKVIVVSADLKNDCVEFSSVEFTLKDYLSGGCTLESTVQSISEYFKIILGSGSAGDYSDLLHTEKFADLIKRLKSEYDFVLIDAPSFSTASEAMILSKLADSLVLVVEEGNTKIDDFSEFTKKLRKQNITIKGVILNKVSESENLEIKLI